MIKINLKKQRMPFSLNACIKKFECSDILIVNSECNSNDDCNGYNIRISINTIDFYIIGVILGILMILCVYCLCCKCIEIKKTAKHYEIIGALSSDVDSIDSSSSNV